MFNFRLKILLRILLILVLGWASIYVITATYFWLVSFWLLLFLVIAFAELIRFLERSKKQLTNFLISIKQKDFSNTYPKKAKNHLDDNLHHAFTTITNEFQQLRKEKESNYHFLQAVVEHSGIPLLGYDEESLKVSLMNKTAKELFKKSYLHQINALDQVDSQLVGTVLQLRSGEKELIKIVIDNELLHLSVVAKQIKIDGRLYKLVSFQNIKAELDEKELESWQKLIRVLTHEIKNSAIPISTLTEVVSQMIIDEKGELKDLALLELEDLDDLKVGIRTVQKRSKGLVNFVNAYGELAKTPQPRMQPLSVNEIITEIEALLSHDLRQAGISLKKNIDPALEIQADADMVEQILINLIKNAREALSQTAHPVIELSAYTKNCRTTIAVKDNGPGIDTNALDQVFIPFYTTKKNGSGIGLSLSSQYMRAHKGYLTVSSSPGAGTTFLMIF